MDVDDSAADAAAAHHLDTTRTAQWVAGDLLRSELTPALAPGPSIADDRDDA